MEEGSGLREFVTAYVLEAEEHLENANTQLLAVEAAVKAGGANLKGVREAFRALHTIKGLSAMVGVEPVVAIAHRLEAVLRSYDRRGARLPIQSIDALLQGIRSMQTRVQAFGAGKPVAAPEPGLLVALDALDAGHGAEVELPPLALDPLLASKLGTLELEQLRSGLTTGHRVLRVDFVPSLEKSARGVTIREVRDRVQRLGEIVKVFPVANSGDASAAGNLAFVIVLVTDAPNEAVAEAATVEVSAVHLVADPPPKPLARAEGTQMEDAEPAGLAVEEVELPQRGVVRVDVSRLDETVEGLSALIVTRYRLARAVRSLRDRGVDTREIEEIVGDNARQLRNLRGAILRVRMVPVSEMLDRLPLVVRGLRRTMNRLVDVEIDSGGAEVDKSVAERLFPALVHLVRNAVDHAIETPDERTRRGKPDHGRIRIECRARSNRWLEIRVVDDGRGIDAEVVGRRARTAIPTTPAALLDLICRSGLTTRDVPTTVSGRGVGMEIVQRVVVEQLGGELTLETELGRGTTFSLLVPITISVVDAFSFLCAGQRFVTPVLTIEEIVELDARGIVQGPSFGGRAVRLVRHRGRAVPLLSLAEVFAMDAPANETKALIVRRGEESLAFAIERMLGQQEVVVRPLNDVLVKVPGVSGATDLGDGQPTLVLDLPLLGARLSARGAEAAG